MSVVAEVDAGL